MPPVTKIYELRTLGYDQVINELRAVDKAFESIKKTKLELNKQKLDTQESEELKRINALLDEEIKKEKELTLQRQKLINEAKAEQVERQARINEEKQFDEAIKKTTSSVKAQIGSYAQLYAQQRQLYALIKVNDGNTPINFGGVTFTFDQAINEYKRLSAAEQAFRRQFAADKTLVGEYTTGIVQAFKQLGLEELVGNQANQAKDRVNELNAEFDNLKKELEEIKKKGDGNFDALEADLIANRKEALELQQQVNRLNTELRGTGDIGTQITSGLAKGFKDMKGQLSQFVLGYVGFQAVFNGLQEGVSITKELADQTTNLEIELGKVDGGANKLVNSLKGLNTRTKLTGLEEIANTAAKAGVAEDKLLGVVTAVDKTKIAFGKDFGSIEEGTETFAKLINIFFEDREITGERILKIGNSIRTLANETVASVPFINDFNGRMAGLKQLFTNFTLGQSIGLGAGFEEFKQSAEVSSTVLVKVLPKIASDADKFAAIANRSSEDFKKLLNENPIEALLLVAENLVKSGADVEEVSKQLADSELGSGRITTILATLGGKADVFRERIQKASAAIQETTAVEDAFEKKNNNLAGTLDKISKKFSDAAGSTAFQVTLKVIAAIVTFLIGNLPIIIGLLSLYAIGWLTVAKQVEIAGVATTVTNGQLLLQRAQLIANNILLGAYRLYLIAATIAQSSYNAVLALFTGVMNRATVATTLFSNATRLIPLGIILTVIGAVVASMRAFAGAVSNTTEALRRQALQQKITAEVTAKANESISKQISELDVLVNTLLSSESSYDTSRQALEKLISIYPQFSTALKNQVIDLNAVRKAYDEVTKGIKLNAEAEASATLTAERKKSVLEVASLRQKFEITAAQTRDRNKTLSVNDLTDEELSLLNSSDQILKNSFARENASGGFNFTLKDIDVIKKFLENKEKQATDVYQAYIEFQTKKQQELNNFEQNQRAVAGKLRADAANSVEVDIEFLNSQIQQLDEQIKNFRGSQKGLDSLIQQREALQKRLDAALGKKNTVKPAGASSLTGVQKDDIKDIDALRDEMLANEKLRLRENQISEEEFLLNILRINKDAIDKKLFLLKGANAEERKQIAELRLDRVNQEQDTLDKIFELRKAALKKQLDQNIQNIRDNDERIQKDPVASNTSKAQSKLDSDKAILDLQEKFAAALDTLEKQLGQNSIKNSKETADAIRKLRKEINEDQLKLTDAALKDQQAAGEKEIARFKEQIAKMRLAISTSDKSPQKKLQANQALDDVEKVGLLGREVANMQSQLPIMKKLFEEARITETEYLKFLEQLQIKQRELNNAISGDIEKAGQKVNTVGDLIKVKLSSLFNFDLSTQKGRDQAALFAQTVQQAYAVAGQAMDAYFERQRQNVEREKELAIKRLDIELDQRKNQAQSQAERDSLDRQYQQKKEAAERQAFEKNKKIQLAQAKVNLAIALANLAVVAFGPNPLNIATLGIAGAIQYAIQAALLVAQYKINTNNIRNAQYEFGGKPGESSSVPTRGGKFGGRPHSEGGTPFVFKGQQYEAEVDELSVIRTKNVNRNKIYSFSGTQSQIASALNVAGGGRNFDPGAKIRKFAYGGSLGDGLQAPIYVPNTIYEARQAVNRSAAGNSVDDLRQEILLMAEAQSKRIDNLKVEQVTSTVTNAQKKLVQQEEIGTLGYFKQ